MELYKLKNAYNILVIMYVINSLRASKFILETG